MRTRIAMAMTVMLLLPGCSKLTLENYNKINMGMPYDEVTQLIGKPDSCDDPMGVRSVQRITLPIGRSGSTICMPKKSRCRHCLRMSPKY